MTAEQRTTGRSAMLELMVATAVSGGAGYLLTVVAGKMLGATSYASFAVFWSALYLVVSAIAGIQQEVTRGARRRFVSAQGRPVARNFGAATAVVLVIATLATGIVWGRWVFPADGFALIVPLAIGVAAYAVIAVFSGILYGLELWRAIATMTAIDGILRLILVVGVMAITNDLRIIAWAIVLPFAITPMLMWLLFRRRVIGRYELDVGYRALTWNTLRTLIGASATGVLISGFPLLLGATSTHEATKSVAALLFSANVTRAPILVVVLALQSFLIVYFRNLVARRWQRLLAISSAIAGLTGLAALAVALVGPWLLDTFLGADFALTSATLAQLVGSAGVLAILCATGPALIAARYHAWFTAGWVAAAVATALLLLLPLDLDSRTLLALWVGPLIGLLIHGFGLTRPPGSALDDVGARTETGQSA